MSPPVTLITANYGDSRHTAALAQSVAGLRDPHRCLVVVVNNGATPESRAAVEEAISPVKRHARVFHLERNLYYWGGVAYALEQLYPEPGALPSWIIGCNNDIIFEDDTFLDQLLAIDPDRSGVIAPSIRSTITGRDQNPFQRKPPGLSERLRWKAYYSNYFLARCLLAIRDLVSAPVGHPLSQTRAGGAPPVDGEMIYAPHGPA